MARRLDARDASFPQAFAALLSAKREVSEDVDQAVRAIIEDVVTGAPA
jgi:histidinol dehydrogenase